MKYESIQSKGGVVLASALIFAATWTVALAADALYVDPQGNVGIGTTAPQAPLHINRTNAGVQEMFRFSNVGGSFITWEKSSNNNFWYMTHENSAGGRLIFDHAVGGAPGDGPEFSITPAGNVVTQGTVTANGVLLTSDREKKEGIVPVDGELLLSKLDQLEVTEWQFKEDATQTRHIGPMAQDFQAVFNLSDDDKHISAGDLAGVSLAAIKELNTKLDKKEAEIAMLKKERIADRNEYEARFAELEARLQKD